MSYGDLYWCIKTGLSENGNIYCHGDAVVINENGDLIIVREDKVVMITISAGNWNCVYAASCFDGSPVCVEHWRGEIIEEGISR